MIYERFGSISQFVFALPGMRVLPAEVELDPELLRPPGVTERRRPGEPVPRSVRTTREGEHGTHDDSTDAAPLGQPR